jgi:hypothetical protein
MVIFVQMRCIVFLSRFATRQRYRINRCNADSPEKTARSLPDSLNASHSLRATRSEPLATTIHCDNAHERLNAKSGLVIQTANSNNNANNSIRPQNPPTAFAHSARPQSLCQHLFCLRLPTFFRRFVFFLAALPIVFRHVFVTFSSCFHHLLRLFF